MLAGNRSIGGHHRIIDISLEDRDYLLGAALTGGGSKIRADDLRRIDRADGRDAHEGVHPLGLATVGTTFCRGHQAPIPLAFRDSH